jgi:hypothetical protein
VHALGCEVDAVVLVAPFLPFFVVVVVVVVVVVFVVAVDDEGDGDGDGVLVAAAAYDFFGAGVVEGVPVEGAVVVVVFVVVVVGAATQTFFFSPGFATWQVLEAQSFACWQVCPSFLLPAEAAPPAKRMARAAKALSALFKRGLRARAGVLPAQRGRNVAERRT